MVILARIKLTAENVENKEGDNVPLESCAADLFPTNAPEDRIRLTGVYIAPRQTTRLTPDILLRCSKVEKKPHAAKKDEKLPHLIMGGLKSTELEQSPGRVVWRRGTLEFG